MTRDKRSIRNCQEPRHSNIELLRIISMFLVLIVHADFWSLGRPTSLDMQITPLASYTRFFIESLAIVCVNIFVLISGWFGINPSVKSFSKFAFQCLFFLTGHFVVRLVIGESYLNLKGIVRHFCLLSDYWFIKSYVGLYILAPILNAFVKVANKIQMKSLLIVFFLYQTIYGWFGAADFFANGYSTMSFMGLYMLGRYLNVYGKIQTSRPIPPFVWICIYMTCCITNTILAPIISFLNIYSYLSPLVILASVSIFLVFSNLKMKTYKIINWIAASCFAIYLFHVDQGGIGNVFRQTIAAIYSSTSGILCIVEIGLFLVGVSVIAIMLDQIRILLWNLISNMIERLILKYKKAAPIWEYRFDSK